MIRAFVKRHPMLHSALMPFVMTKRLGWKYAYWRYIQSRPYNHFSRALPSSVALSITEKCSLRCEYCAKETVHSVPDMSFEQYRLLLSKLWWTVGVNIIGLGEPLIHPDVTKIIRWTLDNAHRPIVLSTNGMFPLEMHSGLVEALLDCHQIQFSLDTINPVHLKRIRRGADFAQIDRNLRLFLNAKQQRVRENRHVPIVNINAVLTEATISGMTDLIKYVETLPPTLDYLQLNSVTLVYYQSAHAALFEKEAYRPHVVDATNYVQSSQRCILAGQDMDFIRHMRTSEQGGVFAVLGLYPDKIVDSPTAWKQCRSIYTGLGIRPNGEMYMCCYWPDMNLGNAFIDDILAKWNSSRANELREQVLTDNPPEFCHGCNFAYEGTYPVWVPKHPAE